MSRWWFDSTQGLVSKSSEVVKRGRFKISSLTGSQVRSLPFVFKKLSKFNFVS